MKKWALALALAVLAATPARAVTFQPTVNPLVPTQNSPLVSAVVRNNFQATYNDEVTIAGLIPGAGSGTVTNVSCSGSPPVVCTVNNGTTTPQINLSLPVHGQAANNVQMSLGSTTSGDVAIFDGNGNLIDGGGAGGSVTWPTTHDIVVSNSTNTPVGLNGTTGQVLQFNGASSDPTAVSTLSSTVQGNITTVGTIGSGTWQGGVIQPSYLAVSTSTTEGIVQPDNSTITISNGVISAVGGGSGGNPNVLAYSVYGNATGSTTTGTSLQSVFLGAPNFTDTGVAIQATTSTNSYYQTILDNTSTGTAASVAYTTAINGTTSTTKYAEFGQNGSLYATGTSALNGAGNGYLDTVGEDIAIGTLTNNALHFTTSAQSTDDMVITGAHAVTVNDATTLAGAVTASSSFKVTGALPSLSGGNAALGSTSTAGGILAGDGSTNDITVENKANTNVCTVATGTTNWNCTGLQVGGTSVLTANQSITLSGIVTGSGTTAITTAFGTFSSATLAAALSDETGTGVVVYSTSPSLVTPVIGAATGTSLQFTATGSAPAGAPAIFSPVAGALEMTVTGAVNALELLPTGPEVATTGAFVSAPDTLSIATSTFTPVAVASNTYRVVLVHASCPCTIAAPSGTAVDGQRFIIEVWQSATGGDTVSWTTGSSGDYDFGTAGAPTLSTGASKGDLVGFSYSAQNSRYNYIGIQQGM